MNWVFVVLLAFAVGLEIIADFFFKSWANQNKFSLIALGLALYFIGTIFWAYSLKFESLSKAILFFTVINLIVISLMGMILFHEKLNAWNQLGLGVGVASVILMEV